MTPSEIEALIQAGLPGVRVKVLSDDNTHFSARIVSNTFEGKRTLQRHQLVYAALGKYMGGAIHALTMQTLTETEAVAEGIQLPAQQGGE